MAYTVINGFIFQISFWAKGTKFDKSEVCVNGNTHVENERTIMVSCFRVRLVSLF